MSNLKISLDKTKRPASGVAAKAPPPKKRLVFGAEDDDANNDAPGPDPTKRPVQRSTFMPKKMEDEIDPSIYDYDGAFDAIHARDAIKKVAEQEDARLRRPKYMDGFLASAKLRKRDQLRAQEKMTQFEREAEGDMYNDREQFVTESYKKQQAENARLEEEELRKEVEEAEKRARLGMRGFHQTVMEADDQRHQETIKTAAAVVSGETTIAPIDFADANKQHLDKAKELVAQGTRVAISDEGQVADKRQLLTAGLNIVPTPKSKLGSGLNGGGSSADQDQKQRTLGRPSDHANSRRNDRQTGRTRQSQYIEQQIEEATKNTAQQEAEQLRKQSEAAKSKKTTTDISSARERYLQRKAEAAKTGGNA